MFVILMHIHQYTALYRICCHVVHIREWTSKDPVLSRVMLYINSGWPADLGNDFKPYENKRLELTSHMGCLLWNNRVVIPLPGRATVLNELYEGHPGISRMKSLAQTIAGGVVARHGQRNRRKSPSMC